MSIADNRHENKPAHPHENLPSLIDRASDTSVPVPQGEADNALSTALGASGIFHSIPFQRTRTFSSAPAVSPDNSQSDPPGVLPFSTVGTRWASQPSSPSLASISRLRAPPPFFTFDAGAQFTRQVSVPAFPIPTQVLPGPLHTQYNYLPGQYAMPSHSPPFQSQPSQAYAYDEYRQLGSSSYLPTSYYPLPPHLPFPYVSGAHTEGRHPPYQQMQPLLPLMSQSFGPSHLESSGEQHQSSGRQWRHSLGSSPNTFPTRAQQSPSRSSHRQRQDTRRDSAPERLPPPAPDRQRDFVATATLRNTISPAATEPSNQTSAQSSSKIDIREPSNRLPVTHDRPPVRRHYHPNPPPNRSEWVMWVGNVPSDTTHDELWRFLSSSISVPPAPEDRDGVEDNGVLSLFLISRSSCAFVNYRSKEQLDDAINQFNGCQLRPDDPRCPRLVCRARRKEDDLRAGVGGQRGMGVHARHAKSTKDNELMGDRTTFPKGRWPDITSVQPSSLLISRDEEVSRSDIVEGDSPKAPTRSSSSYASTTSSLLIQHFPKRFFILKSLTRHDLDLSVERGVWATQKHNESILDQAFRTSKEVVLIFSVNKSGEFYGYARMVSGILQSTRSVSWAPRTDSPPPASSQSSSNVPSHSAMEQSEGSSHQSSELLVLPSEPQSAEAAAVLSPDERKADTPAPSSSQVRSTQERRSAPPAFARLSEDPSLRSPVQSSLDHSRKGLPRDPGAHSAPLPISGKHFWTGVRGRSTGGDAGDVSKHDSQLQPVMEEVHRGSGGDEGIQSAVTAVQNEVPPGRRGVQQNETSWGETFRVEWLQTERVPFHRTRHLRNPWNHGREIKVARDGTEIEPTVGQRLIEEWSTLASAASRGGPQSGAAAGGSGEAM